MKSYHGYLMLNYYENPEKYKVCPSNQKKGKPKNMTEAPKSYIQRNNYSTKHCGLR